MSKKKPTVFKDIKLVGVHKEPTFGPEGLVIDLRLTAASKCIEEQLKIIKQLRTELDKANERIKKMSKGDLGPESILSGYNVLVKSLEKRRNELRAELHTAKAENEDLCNNIDATRQDMADMLAGTLEGKLWAENERLKEFARPVIRQECWSIFEQDGLDIHDLAEKLGLIVPCTATEEDVDETIFRFSETLKESD